MTEKERAIQRLQALCGGRLSLMLLRWLRVISVGAVDELADHFRSARGGRKDEEHER